MKQIEGYENYSVTEDGKVINTKTNKVIAITKSSNYCYVSLYNKDKKIKRVLLHRLVAKAYIPNPENKPQINHKDMNRSNNNTSNLEWVTQSENVIHAFKNGRISNKLGTKRKPEAIVKSVTTRKANREAKNQLEN